MYIIEKEEEREEEREEEEKEEEEIRTLHDMNKLLMDMYTFKLKCDNLENYIRPLRH